MTRQTYVNEFYLILQTFSYTSYFNRNGITETEMAVK